MTTSRFTCCGSTTMARSISCSRIDHVCLVFQRDQGTQPALVDLGDVDAGRIVGRVLAQALQIALPAHGE